jgi:hypothetical protein
METNTHLHRLFNETLNKIPDTGLYQKQDFMYLTENPTFIITYGPPASGKGHLMDNLDIFHKMKIRVNINIDDIIEQHPNFKLDSKKCKELINQFNCPIISSTEQNTDYINMINTCSTNYLKYKNSGADNISTLLLLYSLKNNLNIIYETTGNNIDWTLKTVIPIIPTNYSLIIIYPLVSENILLKRSCERGKKIGRFPENNVIKNTIINAQNNLLKLLDSDNVLLKNCKVQIYDNENTSPELLVDIFIENGKRKIIINNKDTLNKLAPILFNSFNQNGGSGSGSGSGSQIREHYFTILDNIWRT